MSIESCPMPDCGNQCGVHDYCHNDHDNIQWSVDCIVCDYCAGPYPTKEKAIDAHRQITMARKMMKLISEWKFTDPVDDLNAFMIFKYQAKAVYDGTSIQIEKGKRE